MQVHTQRLEFVPHQSAGYKNMTLNVQVPVSNREYNWVLSKNTEARWVLHFPDRTTLITTAYVRL